MNDAEDTQYSGTIAGLIEGAIAFREREYRSDQERMSELAEQQSPEVLMIGCSDSRVDPAIICGAQPGEIFTVRVVANLVPYFSLAVGQGQGVRAAIEYAVQHLGVSDIVVFGHARCGGIKAAIDTAAGNAPETDFIGPWLEMARPACHQEVVDQETGERRPVPIENLQEYSYLVERASVLQSVENLRTYPWIRDRLDAGQITLHGWWFDLETGDLWTTSPKDGHFLPVEGR